jgi:hypothetical protein
MTNSNDTKQAAAHTPEPWYVSTLADNTPVVQSATLEEDNFICQVEGRDNDEAHANARRICAAVNACGGIPTEALEQGVVRELVEALEVFYNWLTPDWQQSTLAGKARTAIAKANGRAA